MSWTKERIEKLPPSEIRSLRKNALERGVQDVADLCGEVLSSKVKAAVSRTPKARPSGQHPRRVSRKKAMEMRGVTLHNPRWSWGAIREADGMPVLTIWAEEITQTASGYESMLWGPDLDGSRPWSDTHGGRERHGHCKVAAQKGEGEGVLIYGAQSGRDLPAGGQASKVEGADPNTVIHFQVEMRGEDYWAVWDRGAVIPQKDPGEA